jgi:carboxymethylenebutenolidase
MASGTDKNMNIQGADGTTARLLFTPADGSGPGLILLMEADTPERTLAARATLFAEEGYTVFALRGISTVDDIDNAARALAVLPEATGGPVCVAHGIVGVSALQAADAFQAIVAFDVPGLAETSNLLSACPCPVVLQFGTMGGDSVTNAAESLAPHINAANGSRIYTWADAAPGFSLPGDAAFDSRVDSLAHSRTLELIRRVVGPYYDYVALFAEHIRHEFETRDVDATMETMIGDPYVNHVATLAGGVGHDMLKRFYKYHFVEQNSKDRSSVTVSHTLGPDRVVLELVVRFKHDQVLDRYFPGIPPTGQDVELATVLIVKFRGDKVCHEHIYWDQGSALKQISVLDADHLPVAGAEAARKVLDEHRPSNIFMEDAWATSEGKPI